jgi:hypothetical protein
MGLLYILAYISVTELRSGRKLSEANKKISGTTAKVAPLSWGIEILLGLLNPSERVITLSRFGSPTTDTAAFATGCIGWHIAHSLRASGASCQRV